MSRMESGRAGRRSGRLTIGVWHRSNTVTYLGLAAAGLGIALVTYHPTVSVICLVICGICDLYDGAFARRFERSEMVKAFGIQLDSLADMVCFIALPLALLATSGLPWWVLAPAALVYAGAGVTRLAHFNLTTDGRPAPYRGVPVTVSALLIPLVWLIEQGFGLDRGWILLSAMVALGIGFVLNLPVPKPHGKAYLAFAGLAIAAIAALMWTMVN